MRFLFTALAVVLLAGQAFASETPVPSKDVAGSDLPWLKRYAGSTILNFRQNEFDEVDFVASPLKPQQGRDAANNSLRVPDKLQTAQGRSTQFVYLMPEGRSPLEATAGYAQELAQRGAKVVFECKDKQCGGSIGRPIDAGGGEQGLIHYVFAREHLPEKLFSPGRCVLTAPNTGQRYVLFKTESAHVSIFAAQVKTERDCKQFNNRTIAIVTVLEDKAREQRMEVVDAKKMASDITSQGRAILYGLQFDTDKATIKPESKPQLDQIAAFLKSNKGQFFVVGHTDNQGAPDYNLDLSRRRSAAVSQALSKDYGIAGARLIGVGVGMVAPIAANTDEAGRSKNRRVEIVPR
jgi:outer membrane protein OmpA-like peptidoglycan-associated protein